MDASQCRNDRSRFGLPAVTPETAGYNVIRVSMQTYQQVFIENMGVQHLQDQVKLFHTISPSCTMSMEKAQVEAQEVFWRFSKQIFSHYFIPYFRRQSPLILMSTSATSVFRSAVVFVICKTCSATHLQINTKRAGYQVSSKGETAMHWRAMLQKCISL